MYGGHTTREVLIPVAAYDKAGVDNHVPELLLRGEPLDALHQVLVRVPVPGDELADEGDGAEAPPLVDGVEEGEAVDLAELEDGEDAAGLEDAVGLPEGGGDVAEVPDAKGHGIEVHRGRLDLAREVLGVGLEEGEGRLLRGGELRRPLLADGEHVGVDVGDGDAHVGVAVAHVRLV